MTILDTIIEYKKNEVEKQKRSLSLDDIVSRCNDLLKVPKGSNSTSFLKSLENCKKSNKICLIAEVKKASPSLGLIKESFKGYFPYRKIACAYEKAGASAISVLTDENFFQGSIEYLKEIKKTVKIPVLRKDFIIDEYQIFQTLEMGADIILLIASILDKHQLRDFYAVSAEKGLSVLLEVHDRTEFDFALEIGANIIGINNRNLKTFEVDLNTTIELIKGCAESEKFFISESGIKTAEHVSLLKSFGASGILVGESLIVSEDIQKAVLELIN